MDDLTTIRDVLVRAADLPWDAKLFLPKDAVLNLDTQCAVLTDDPDTTDVDESPFAQAHGLQYVLGMVDVQDIVLNAQQQITDVTPEQLLAAFLFYHKRDAFIVFRDE